MVRQYLIDSVAIVSSDPDIHLGVRSIIGRDVARSVMLFRTGAEIMQYLGDSESVGRCVAVVDASVSDIAPLNLVDAIRRTSPDVDLVVALESRDESLVQRAMLAGAHAAVQKDCSPEDLRTAIERVIFARSATRVTDHRSHRADHLEPSAATVLAVIGARGGAGRSTLSCLLAHVAASAGIDTALVDLDFQFGDLATLHGIDIGGTCTTENISPRDGEYSIRQAVVSDNLTLYWPPPGVERPDALGTSVSEIIARIAKCHSLAVLNTGTFSSYQHAEILSAAHQVVCVLDQTLIGIRSTVQMVATCRRIGIPTVGFEYVVNRWIPQGIGNRDIARALDAEQLRTVPDGGHEMRVGLDSGSISTVAEGNSEVAESVRLVLEDVAARAGLPLVGKITGRSKTRGRRRILGGARG